MSVAIATGLYGISFGALSLSAGLGLWQTQALSALMFTGGSQFAFIGTVAAGGAEAFAAASLLGVRNAVYGAEIKALFQPRGAAVPLHAHFTIDESVATAFAQQVSADQRRGFWTAGLGVFALWNLFTLLGALAGSRMGDPAAWGLDGAAVAAFCGLLWPRLNSRNAWLIAGIAAAVSVLSVPWVAPGVPILLAALVAAAVSQVLGPSGPPESRQPDDGSGA